MIADLTLNLRIADLRNIVSVWLQRPTIIALHNFVAKGSQTILPVFASTESPDLCRTIANSENSYRESTTAGIVIICPTNLDCQILAESGVIHLSRGDAITVVNYTDKQPQDSKSSIRFE